MPVLKLGLFPVNFTGTPKCCSHSALSSDRRSPMPAYLLTAFHYGFQNSGVYSIRTVQVRPSGGQAHVSNFVCTPQGPRGRTALHTACQADTCGE